MPSMLRMAAGLMLALAAAPAAAETWRLDPVHTRVLFVVDHAGLSRAMGAFSGVQGRLQFDPGQWPDARVELTVPLDSLELGDADWRAKVLGGTFLDADAHPEARFVSTSVELEPATPEGAGAAAGTGTAATDPAAAAGSTRARIHGQLTLRGVTRPVELLARLNAVKRHPITRRRSVGFSATATLSRRDFGIVDWPNVIGDDVELLIEVEALLDRGAAPLLPDTPEPADAADPQHR